MPESKIRRIFFLRGCNAMLLTTEGTVLND
jgi:hypothetical protein